MLLPIVLAKDKNPHLLTITKILGSLDFIELQFDINQLIPYSIVTHQLMTKIK